MIITSVSTNGLAKVRDGRYPLSTRTLITGACGAGKTGICEALHAAASSAAGMLVGQLPTRSDDGSAKVTLTWSLAEAEARRIECEPEQTTELIIGATSTRSAKHRNLMTGALRQLHLRGDLLNHLSYAEADSSPSQILVDWSLGLSEAPDSAAELLRFGGLRLAKPTRVGGVLVPRFAKGSALITLEELSSGERSLARLTAGLGAANAAMLILDDVDSYWDANTARAFLAFLAESFGGQLIVTSRHVGQISGFSTVNLDGVTR